MISFSNENCSINLEPDLTAAFTGLFALKTSKSYILPKIKLANHSDDFCIP